MPGRRVSRKRSRRWRLGYGGGYVDRTLASLSPRAATFDIGGQSACPATICPQPHDLPFDTILAETGVASDCSAR